MELKSIDEIGEKLVVFMPSGIQATLTRDGDNVIVEYPEMYQDKYSKKEFESLIEQGIFIFNERPTTQVIEAYEQEENPQGTMKELADEDENNQYLTADYKLAMLDALDKIFKEYPDVHAREQARIFIDEIGLQEYYDIKAIEDFIKDHQMAKFTADKNESLNEENGEHYGEMFCEEIAKQLEEGNKSGHCDNLGAWDLKTSLDMHWEQMTQDAQQYILEEIAMPVRDGHLNYTDLQIVIHTGSNLTKEDLMSMQIFDDEEIDAMFAIDGEMNGYISFEIIMENPVDNMEEAFKVKKRKKKKLDELSKNEELEKVENKEINEGMWASPFTVKNAKKIAELLANPITLGELNSEEIQKELWNVIGDDGFWDAVADETTVEPDCDARPLIISNLETWIDNKENFRNGAYYQEAEDIIVKAIDKFMNNSKNEELEDEEPELGLYIQTTGELYKKHIQDKKDVNWDELIKDGAEMYKKEIENKEFSDEEKAQAKEYLKNYFTESIYLKDEEGNEEGPFEDQEAANAFIQDQKDHGVNKEYEEEIKEEDMSKTKNEDCYKVYNNMLGDAEAACFQNWNEVEEYLNAQWGEYKADKAKENAEFGTEADKEEFFGGYDIAIEPMVIEIDVEDPICPECGEVCDCEDGQCDCEEQPEIEAPIELPAEQPEEPIEDPAEEPMDMDTVQELENDIEAALTDEEIEEAVNEMCMCKLPDPEKAQKENEQEDDKIEEAFSDNMGMLTDINDLDFPDALHDAVDTKEDGSLYRISDLAKELAELKELVKSEIEAIKNDIKTTLQDVKQDIKAEVNDVENKVQDTKSAVADLTSEEEDLEDVEFMDQQPEEAPEEPAEENEEPAQDEEEAPAEDEENMEESIDIEKLAGDPIFEAVKNVMESNTHPQGYMSIPTLAQRVREEYGINTKIESTYNTVANYVLKTSYKEHIVDLPTEQRSLKESMLGKAAKWLSGGLMGRLNEEKEARKNEDLNKIKQEIDKMAKEGKDAKEIKDAITLSSENDQEADQAADYAVQKLNQAESLKESLLRTASTAKLNNLF